MDMLFELVTLPLELLSGAHECFCTCLALLGISACLVIGAFVFFVSNNL